MVEDTGSMVSYLSSIASYGATMSGYLSSIYTYTSNTASRLSTANGYLSTIATNSTSMVTYLSNIATYTSNAASYLSSISTYASTIASRLSTANGYLATMDVDTGNIAASLTYNSGSAAYWLYLIYDALADASSSLTALDRLTSIYTELSNLNETVEGLNLDITVDVSSSFADTLASALPDALSLTTLTVDFSGLADALVGIDFNIGNLADIDIDTASIVDALEELLAYGSYDAAQLLYLCWGELQGLEVEVPEVDFTDVIEVLADILEALTYVTDDDSLLSTASVDGVAAVASTSTSVTNAQLLYKLLAKMSSYTDYLEGIDSGLSKILYRLATEDDDDFLEALQTFAESLLTSSTLATVAASAAEQLSSVLLPLVVLNLTIDLFLSILSVDPVEPEFEIVIPIIEGTTFYDSFTFEYFDDFWPAVQAFMLLFYAIGLASSFKEWVTKLGGD